MADSVMSYAIVAGIFAFLAAVVFGARSRLYSLGMAKLARKATRTPKLPSTVTAVASVYMLEKRMRGVQK